MLSVIVFYEHYVKVRFFVVTGRMNRTLFVSFLVALPACVVQPATPVNQPGPGDQQPPPSGGDELPIDPSQPMPEGSLGTDATLQLGAVAKVTIDGRSDVYSAGADSADKDRAGVLPTRVTLASGGSAITFERVVGKAGCMADAAFGPDGGDCAGGYTDLTTPGNISGIVAHDRTLFMVGVFIGGAPWSAPDRLDFSPEALGVEFSELSPKIGQVFFIGDGSTASGVAQKFVIPDGASALYLGYADGWGFQGAPGAYGDNTGGLSVSLVER